MHYEADGMGCDDRRFERTQEIMFLRYCTFQGSRAEKSDLKEHPIFFAMWAPFCFYIYPGSVWSVSQRMVHG